MRKKQIVGSYRCFDLMPIERLKRIKNRVVPKGSFAESAATMLTGTALAQAVPVLLSPVLTRQYSPADFGGFAVYSAVVAAVAVFSTGGYDNAIILANDEKSASNSFFLSLIITAILTLLCIVAVIFGGPSIAGLLNVSGESGWVFLIPVGIFLVGLYRAFNYWLIRKKMYKRLAARKVLQSLVMIVFQIVLGFMAFGGTGLIIGYIAGQVAGYAFLAWQIWREDSDKLGYLSFDAAWEQAKEYKNFCFFTTPSDFVGVLAAQAPNVLITKVFSVSMGGLFSLPKRMLDVPVTLLSQSVFDVFKERASRDYRESGNCRLIYRKTLKALVLLSILPFFFFFFLSPWLVPFVFGEQWRVAGEYARFLSIASLFYFVANPLMYVFSVVGRQYYELLLRLALLVLVVGSVYMGACMGSPLMSVKLMAASYAIVYAIGTVITYWLSGGASGATYK